MKGIYCLVMNVKKDIETEVGALGNISFKKGNYIYVGSAQNGIEQRVRRHSRKNKKKHWHIDYLLSDKNVELIKYLYKKAGKEEECRLACFFLSSFEEPIDKFGCSDCNCKSHLFRIKKLDISKLNMREAR